MITTNIWLVFTVYLIYVFISIPLFFVTSGGWMSIFLYIAFAGLFYTTTTIFLFFSATARTAKRRTKVRIKIKKIPKIIGLKTFVILFNYGSCGDTICHQGFLPNLLEEASLPVIFTPPFVVVLLALLLYLAFLSMFLLDVA